MEMEGDLYAVDLDDEYRPTGPRNYSRGQNTADEGEFSGMGPTAVSQTSNSLTTPLSIKVTHRCEAGRVCVCVCKCVSQMCEI